jgi:hypothetical protein
METYLLHRESQVDYCPQLIETDQDSNRNLTQNSVWEKMHKTRITLVVLSPGERVIMFRHNIQRYNTENSLKCTFARHPNVVKPLAARAPPSKA